MTFSMLSIYLERLEKTASRNEITQILSELFKESEPTEIDKICYLVLGELLPSYRGIEFNLAERMMIRVVAQTYGAPPEDVMALYKKKGDLGDVVEKVKSQKLKVKNTSQKLKVSVSDVYDKLMEVAMESGSGSQERKIVGMAELLGELDTLSAKFVVRIPIGKLRLGFSNATILDALSVAEKGDKSARKEIEGAFNVTADIGKIAQVVRRGGLKALQHLKVEPGIPIRPALAERLPSIDKVIEKVGPEVGIEPKLDGFRIAIHVWPSSARTSDGKQVALFSRNLENTTAMFPEIVGAAKKLDVDSVILDGEAIGYNPDTGKFAPFQETVQRKRKHGIDEAAKKLPLTAFVFDILYLNGRDLLDLPFIERRKILEKVLSKKNDNIILDEHMVTSDAQVIARELKKNLDAGLEGIVAKKLDAPYQAGNRGFHWIKLKANTAALAGLRGGGSKVGLPDTIDCIVMAAYRGKGKRATFGVGGLLLGVRGAGDKYYSISRLGTGLSDEQFKDANKRLMGLVSKEKPKEYEVGKDEKPDFWVKPGIVLEILADEITPSPRHTAGVESGQGYSLRFPRLVRFRDDKNPEDATTVKEIESMYNLQGGKK